MAQDRRARQTGYARIVLTGFEDLIDPDVGPDEFVLSGEEIWPEGQDPGVDWDFDVRD